MGQSEVLKRLCRTVEPVEGIRVCIARTEDIKALDEDRTGKLLGPRELGYWRGGFRNKKRRIEWLAGRAAGKYALYQCMAEVSDVDPRPDELEILADGRGAPVYAGPWRLEAGWVPGLSITHTDGIAAAAATFNINGLHPGIDIERKDRKLSDRFIKEVYSAKEEKLLRPLGEDGAREWRLRLWCAREAAAKSLQVGLVGLTRGFGTEEIDFKNGKVYVAVTGLSKDEPDLGTRRWIPVKTVIHGSYILAVSLIH